MKVVITGSSGVIGRKIATHLKDRHELVLIDKNPHADLPTFEADLSIWSAAWVQQLENADAIIHLAANSLAQAAWMDLISPNIDALINVYEAAVKCGVPRFVFASSNHVMGGYKDQCGPGELTTQLPPKPGTHYVVNGEQRDSTPYATTKLLGERLGRYYAVRYDPSVVAIRIGWNKPTPNRWEDIAADRGPWFRQMWLSDRDCQNLFKCCIEAKISTKFAVIYGMSANEGMPWDISQGRRLVGYTPVDGVIAKAVESR